VSTKHGGPSDDVEKSGDSEKLTLEIDRLIHWTLTATQPVVDDRRDSLARRRFGGCGGPRVNSPIRAGSGNENQGRARPSMVESYSVTARGGNEFTHFWNSSTIDLTVQFCIS
jgi:hypothetical protein